MSVSAMPPPKPTSVSRKMKGAMKLEMRKRWKTFPGLMRPSGM
jgi:hypothetical protein